MILINKENEETVNSIKSYMSNNYPGGIWFDQIINILDGDLVFILEKFDKDLSNEEIYAALAVIWDEFQTFGMGEYTETNIKKLYEIANLNKRNPDEINFGAVKCKIYYSLFRELGDDEEIAKRFFTDFDDYKMELETYREIEKKRDAGFDDKDIDELEYFDEFLIEQFRQFKSTIDNELFWGWLANEFNY